MELIGLSIDLHFGPDEELRKEALVAYEKAKEGIKFENRPYLAESTFIMGSAFKDLPPPRKIYHCNPKTWDLMPDEGKAKFEAKVHTDYQFLDNPPT